MRVYGPLVDEMQLAKQSYNFVPLIVGSESRIQMFFSEIKSSGTWISFDVCESKS